MKLLRAPADRAWWMALLLGAVGIGLLAVWGRFDTSPRGLHQVAWGLVALGCFLWMAGDSREEPELVRGAFVALIPYCLVAAFFLYPLLMSDGDFYYGVIRSILWERDANTMDEGVRFSHGWLIEQGPQGGPFGFPSHPFPIGPSLAFIPFVAAGHLEALFRREFLGDPWLTLDGYSAPYLRWCAVGTATWGGLFVFFGYLLLRLRFRHGTSLRTVVACLTGTPAFVYCFRDCGFPHAHSLACLTLLFWLWLRSPRRRDWQQVSLIALALSLATLMRWQNCLFALAPLVYWWTDSIRSKDRPKGLGASLRASLQLGAMSAVLCFPQLVFFRRTGPSWISLQHGGEAWYWETPRFFSVCFDPMYGLWGTNPFYFLAGFGALIHLSKGSHRRFLALIAWAGVWVALAYWGETSPWAAKALLAWTFGLPVGLFMASRPQGNPSSGQKESLLGAVSLLFLVGGLELYINVSYIYYHGGGDYGNRLMVDLVGLVLLGMAGLLNRVRSTGWRWWVSGLWVGSIGWTFALLYKGNPKFTRSPRRLTELVSHTVPFGDTVQGLAHLDLGYLVSGVWLLASLLLSLGGTLALLLFLKKRWVQGARNAARLTMGSLALAVAVSGWLWIDLGRVDQTLYMTLPERGQADLIRQALNTELTPWFPPGRDQFFPLGKERFHLALTEATPEYSVFLPVKWPRPDRSVPYTIDKLALLSRYHGPTELPIGTPLAEIHLSRLNPPSTTHWRVRAGIETDLPTGLRLPPSAPDWYGFDVSSIPRYFVAEFPAQPTQSAEFLEISLLVPEATLEIGALWLSRSPSSGVLSRAANPALHRVTEYDRLLFGRPEFENIPFPKRANPEELRSPYHLFPEQEKGQRWDREFRYLADPWRLAGTVPVELQLPSVDRRRQPGWHLLDWRQPELQVELSPGDYDTFWVALSAGPIPPQWKGGPVALLETVNAEGHRQAKEVFPAGEVAFWEEPYVPWKNLAWFENRGFFAPIGVPVVELPGFPDSSTRQLVVRLSPAAIETGAQVAVVGITGHRRPADRP